jgi:hypothetical protein
MRRGQPDLAQHLVLLRGRVELELVFQLLVEFQRVQLVVELVQLIELVVLELVVPGAGPGLPLRAGRPRASGAGPPQACRTHFTSSGNVGFFPYIRMPTR